MAEYHKMMHMEEIEPDALDEYLSINEENSINQLDIIHLFGKEKLETIQESLSKATGLAFITVDFKGIPLHRQPPFHAIVRRFAITRRQWRDVNLRMPSVPSSDSYTKDKRILLSLRTFGGGHSNYCPRPLSGRFYWGQIQCNDAPESVSRLSSVMHSAKADEAVAEYRPLLEEIPFIHMKNFWI